jgi:hypothetical protein
MIFVQEFDVHIKSKQQLLEDPVDFQTIIWLSANTADCNRDHALNTDLTELEVHSSHRLLQM